MASFVPRGARPAAASLAFVVVALSAVTACGGSAKSGAGSAPPVISTPVSHATTDSRVAQILAKAQSTLAAETSYQFDATESVAAKTPVTTHLVGAVVRNQGVSYTLTVGRTTTQVVRITTATYVRKVPGKWARLKTPRTIADPTGSLLAVLRGLAGATVASTDATSTTLAGTLPATAAKAAGIPVNGEPAQVTVTVDPAGHVTRLTVHTSTQAGTTPVAVTLVTSYSAFGRVPALRRPV